MYAHGITIDEVIPWGKTYNEYCQFFDLEEKNLKQPIACFGDGASGFHAELNLLGKQVVSFDPIYQFCVDELEKRFSEVLVQFGRQIDQRRKGEESMVQEVMSLRESATRKFLRDFKTGKKENRYVNHRLPNEIPFGNNFFGLGLSSHFLCMYDHLGIDFHINSLKEMMRVCKEVRIYPTVNMYGQKSRVLNPLVDFLKENQFAVDFRVVHYKFNTIGKEIMIIRQHGDC